MNSWMMLILIIVGLFGVVYGCVGILNLVDWIFRKRQDSGQKIPMFMDRYLKAKSMRKYDKTRKPTSGAD